MPNIEVDFGKFLPTLGQFYTYFGILKEHKFIKDLTVISEPNCLPQVRIERYEKNKI